MILVNIILEVKIHKRYNQPSKQLLQQNNWIYYCGEQSKHIAVLVSKYGLKKLSSKGY